MKIGFIIVLLVALAANVYVLWHVYQVLPLPTWDKWTVVVLMAAALVMELYVSTKERAVCGLAMALLLFQT